MFANNRRAKTVLNSWDFRNQQEKQMHRGHLVKDKDHLSPAGASGHLTLN